MQVNLERRNGADRRQPGRSSMASVGQASRWNEAAFGAMAGDGNEPYDPYDPYWEPLQGQDDD